MTGLSLVALWLCLACGNVAYQAISDGLFAVAAERSFFQAVALVAVWLSGQPRGDAA